MTGTEEIPKNPGVPNQSRYHCQQKDPQLPEPPVNSGGKQGATVVFVVGSYGR